MSTASVEQVRIVNTDVVPVPPAVEVVETRIELSRDYIHDTAQKLVSRIDARFHDCELKRLAGLVEKAAANSHHRLRGPYRLGFLVKVLVWPSVFATLALVGYGFRSLNLKIEMGNAADFVQGLDAALEILVMVAAASWFFLSLGGRLVRSQLRKAVQELEAIAYMVDFAQLDKDPDRLTWKKEDITPQSPRLGAVSTAFLLSRYLDYCSEILALLAGIGALYGTQVSDPAVLSDLTEFEKMTKQLRLTIGTKMSAISNISRQ